MWKRTEAKSAARAGHPPALLCAILAFTGAMAGSGPAVAQAPRSVHLVEHPAEAADFDLRQSAALFVGIRRFTHDSQVAEVPYAVDDAVDLAFSLSLDLDSRLVEPGRVALALSGEPRKPESQQRLSALTAAGAVIHPAGQADILALLGQQVRAAGRDGVLILSVATHGFSEEGNHYLLSASSLLQHRETALRAEKIFDLVAGSAASRRLLFLDACRERLIAARQVGPDPRSAASPALLRAIAQAQGQVIFFASPIGGYAYDDDVRKNGVFTAAVLDGLQCEAASDERGFVTVNTLQAYVNERVVAWQRAQGDLSLSQGTEGIQVNFDGKAAGMPLAVCERSQSPASNPAAARFMDRSFNVFNRSGLWLWGDQVDGIVAHTETADLDGDGRNEVVVGVGPGGEDTGKILVFDESGELRWSAETTTRFNYAGGQSGRMTVRTFLTGDLFRRGQRQVVVLSQDAEGWYQSRLSVLDSDGRLLSSYHHPGHLHRVALGAPSPEEAPRILVAGLNNDLRPRFKSEANVGAVFVLDPADIRGEAPPYYGRAGKGSHLWYGVLSPAGQAIERLEVVDRDQDGTREISVWTSSGFAFYLDFAGHLLTVAGTDKATLERSTFSLFPEDE